MNCWSCAPALLAGLLLLADVAGAAPGAPADARAHWLAPDRVAWDVPADSAVRIHFDPEGALRIDGSGPVGGESIALQRDGRVDGALAAKFRHLAGLPTWRLAAADVARVPDILRQQYAVAAAAPDGSPRGATGLQIAGVLDALYANDLPLGVHYDAGRPDIRLWAPTARAVRLLLFDGPEPAQAPGATLAMTRDAATGTWSILGEQGWDRKYYLFEVEVFVPATGRFERNRVTDPYSLGLSMNSGRSQFVNLDDADLKPPGWDALPKPSLAAPEDIAIYELHVRDFSIGDQTVPEPLRGTFAAFAQPDSAGARHLRALAQAGLTHVHLLPVADCATIEEDRSRRREPPDLAAYPPDGEQQQAAVAEVQALDGFNWCYDPFHYTVPEGSYATEADGARRILEFRQMVAALAALGLRVVMDVVYNHTTASGQDPRSVLDRIVPGYYHRLDAAGAVETSTCCANTASEHAMMEKLMLDSLRTWAVAYKVDGFRFDLMGHHTRANLERARDRLLALAPATDGVDGRSIYLYGEGWNFGEVANDARFEQATQLNLGRGSGIGTFNDRLRDAVRGGEHSDRGLQHARSQGFINGLYTDPNSAGAGDATERDRLLRLADLLRVGLAGGIADYRFIDYRGETVQARTVDYHGAPAGYASDPQETVNYVAAHDNETLFDINQYKLPVERSADERLRAAKLGTSLVALAQGVPFFHAGQDLLRSKSLDRNSFDSGDWFNRLDFSYSDNGWGRGLPPRAENEGNWPVAAALLADERVRIGAEQIRAAREHMLEMLRIRGSSPLFRLRSGDEIRRRVAFHNTGPDQAPGLLAMSLAGDAGVEIVVVFNADRVAQSVALPSVAGQRFALHPVQRASGDSEVREARYDARSGRFSVPARTTAVFVREPAVTGRP